MNFISSRKEKEREQNHSSKHDKKAKRNDSDEEYVLKIKFNKTSS